MLLTTGCTGALEMSALLIDTKPGDEVIMPSYTFVSAANAFVLRGQRLLLQCLVTLTLYYGLTNEEQAVVIEAVKGFYKK